MKIPSPTEFENIYNSMLKKTPESRKINCECCGYETCERMAIAIYNGFNNKNNCIHYLKNTAEIQKDKAYKLADAVNIEKSKIEDKQFLIIETIRNINNQFAHLHNAVDEMVKGNDQNAKESSAWLYR